MTEPGTTDRLANRLENLRKLGDRNRAQHPVSILRGDVVGQDGAGVTAPEDSTSSAVSIEERTHALARRLFSPLIARAESLAEAIGRE